MPPEDAGLCSTCRWMSRVVSDRGSVFLRCGRSQLDSSFPKYPRLPVLRCRGYEPSVSDPGAGTSRAAR